MDRSAQRQLSGGRGVRARPDGHRDEVVLTALTQPVAGGTAVVLPAITLDAPAFGRPKLVVTEGGWPSVAIIGDENSPFHAQPGWDLD